MRESRLTLILAFIVVAALPTAYVAAYLSLVTHKVIFSEGFAYDYPRYRFGGMLSRKVFGPIHWLDEALIRPDLWHTPDDHDRLGLGIECDCLEDTASQRACSEWKSP